MSISRFAPDSGRVKILHDLSTDIGGRDVVVVEDMVDTGLTLAYLMGQLGARGPRRLSACTLLDRPTRRIVPHELRYRGLELEDEFVLGYGLHAGTLSQPAVRRGGGPRGGRETPMPMSSQLYSEEGAPGAGSRVTTGRTEAP